jgi:beta-lactamase regulating signal transducer with metallopeptidase domain
VTILDHLWQSTLVAVVIAILALLFRNNAASVRYWLWFTASLKFLLPFSLLAEIGQRCFAHPVPASSLALLQRIEPATAPFAAMPAPAAHHVPWMAVAAMLWGLGTLAIAGLWLVRAIRLRRIVRRATRLAIEAPVPVKATAELLEPGLVGIFSPVILLPESLAAKLSRTEIDAILAHELSHLSRRDNLLAAAHMLVEALFWFHPLVWFIGARLVEEREQACDEAVLGGGRKPLDYAQAILKVCRLYVRSPLPCASGVSGADLDRRITAIMTRREVDEVDPRKILLLAVLSAFAVMVPLVAGGLRPIPAAQIVQRVTQLLAPAEQTVPPVLEAAPSPHKTLKRMPVVRPMHRSTLTAPSIEPGVPVIVVPMPQLAQDIPAQPEASESASGDPLVCRPPQNLPDSRLLGPRVCLRQKEWDWMKARGLQLLPDGRTLAGLHDGSRVTAPFFCQVPSGTSTTTGLLGLLSGACR